MRHYFKLKDKLESLVLPRADIRTRLLTLHRLIYSADNYTDYQFNVIKLLLNKSEFVHD